MQTGQGELVVCFPFPVHAAVYKSVATLWVKFVYEILSLLDEIVDGRTGLLRVSFAGRGFRVSFSSVSALCKSLHFVGVSRFWFFSLTILFSLCRR